MVMGGRTVRSPRPGILKLLTIMKKTKWFDRKFRAIEDNGLLPCIIERLSGTPARIAECAGQLSHELLIQKPGGNWSIQEHIGHLSDLEPLWYGRVEDFLAGAAELRAADLSNQRTNTANHNAREIDILLQEFRKQRRRLVEKLMDLEDDQLLNTALHPRLKTPMRMIDSAYFVAEHDDHHLASISEIVNSHS
jgi:uncharacterized damage-inducible protein DinB